jgi:hypothetical protein
MSKIDKGLEEIANDMFKRVGGPFPQSDYEELVRNTYKSMQEHYGEGFFEISEDTVLKVIRQQMMELIRLKRVQKILRKRHNIPGNK